ncbi:MAG: hypothetical protein CL807_06715 [Citromicrobium sp.]|nr:hypothetical protein [Citromicrobium sp.]MAO95631.1 hypothetical protein [Citromicrobium sp.]MBD75338.1 hypothetical protein [Citromicrobium sp.]MBD76569.1 hypothetical protein [Citromicrobium sp.]MBT46400.1 hypothetical protein [Citromicrobium sp.]|tara:strand:+ start:21109 stop:21318 length:210 start_codon:yes stop_codon:yes gene_type:complete
MDLNREYAAHQLALMGVGGAESEETGDADLAKASGIAGRISDFQHGLGAAAACAWSKAHFAHSARLKAQ